MRGMKGMLPGATVTGQFSSVAFRKLPVAAVSGELTDFEYLSVNWRQRGLRGRLGASGASGLSWGVEIGRLRRPASAPRIPPNAGAWNRPAARPSSADQLRATRRALIVESRPIFELKSKAFLRQIRTHTDGRHQTRPRRRRSALLQRCRRRFPQSSRWPLHRTRRVLQSGRGRKKKRP